MHNQKMDGTGTPKQKQKQKLDLSLTNLYAGYDLIMEKKIAIPFIISEKEEENEIVIRIMTGREKEIVFIELQSEEDLFLYYECFIIPHDLKQLNKDYSLDLNQLAEYVLMIEKFLLDIENGAKAGYFQITDSADIPNQKNKQSELTMKITNEINHNIYLVMELSFKRSCETRTNELAAYRYGKLREDINEFEHQICQVKETIRSRNPYLLTFINKI